MSCQRCPLNAKRWAGSGYCKPDAAESEAAKEMQKKLADLQAARATQDATYFPPSTGGAGGMCISGSTFRASSSGCGTSGVCTTDTCKKLK